MKTPRGSVVTYCRVNGVRRTESAAYPCTQEDKQALRISSIYLEAKQIVQGYGQWSDTGSALHLICAYERYVESHNCLNCKIRPLSPHSNVHYTDLETAAPAAMGTLN